MLSLRSVLPTILGIIVVWGSMFASSMVGQDTSDPKIDPKVKDVLESWEKFVKGQDAFSFEAKTSVKSKKSGPSQSLTQVVRFKRPNQLAAVYAQNAGVVNLLADGEQIRFWTPGKRYYSKPQGTSLDEILGGSEFESLSRVLMAACAENPVKVLLKDVREVSYEGKEKISGRECHRLKFTHKSVNWEMWIDAGDEPILRKVTPDALAQMAKNLELAQVQVQAIEEKPVVEVEEPKDSPKSKSKSKKDAKSQPSSKAQPEMACVVSKWSNKPKLTNDSFRFDSPLTKGLEKVESLAELFRTDLAGSGSDNGGAKGLVDQFAPGFALSALGGGTGSLASHLNKNIVILDFWATWCGPCKKSMPTIAKVAGDYQRRGVVFYAVNLEEDPQRVQDFLKEQGWNLPVLFDRDGSVGSSYRANAIPETVIIAPNGKISAVHVGASDRLEAELHHELDQLLFKFPNLTGKAASKANSTRSKKEASSKK